MIRYVLILAALVVLGGGAYLLLREDPQEAICQLDETLTAPSGRAVTLCDVVYEVQPNNASWAVVRVLDPGLPDTITVADRTDHDWVCETWGIAALEKEPRPERIVVQIMQEPFVRGEPAPGITQSIEAYREEGGTCIWELL